MASMFNNADAFNQDISSWNVSSVTDMNNMFDNTDGFNQDISSWNVNNVTTATGFSLNAAQKGTQWLVSEHPSNVGLGNFYSE
jgi:surface protein